MKKIITLLSLLLFVGMSYGKQIDATTAKVVGKAFLSGRTNSTNTGHFDHLQLVYTASSTLNTSQSATQAGNCFYVFNSDNKGFVIVAGDDQVSPILGYATTGSFDPDNIPQNVAKWLEGYTAEIRDIIENDIPATAEISADWDNLLKTENSEMLAKGTASVNPLMQTQWNQSPWYNAQCPGGSVTGCVATAMAQIMKYWNYPASGSGFHSYNHQTYGTLSANFGSTSYQWSSMPNSVNSANSAVATLMYQVGVSVDMNYSPQVSGAYVISAQSPVTNCSEYALKTYFGYKTTLQGVQRVNYNQTQWINLLKAELNASRPILYAGFGSGGGHCFVADGFDNNDYIHFNWGWGGAYDGFFQINSLNPSGTGTGGGSGGYNSGHQAVIGIEPPTSTQTYNMALYNYVSPSASTIYYGQAFSVSTNIANNGTNTFNGDYTVAVFDNAYNFLDYVQVLSGYSLQGGYAYINDLVFSSTGLFSMLPGTYYVGAFYRPTGGNWLQVANSGSYTNLVQMTVINPNDIEMNSAMVLSPGATFTQGQAASVNLNLVNNGTSTFFGEYGVGLYNLDGSFAQTIATMNENNGLPAGYTYLSPYLTFSTSSVTVSPGTYLLAVQHNPSNTGWQLTGSSFFQNPVKVTVVAASIQPDIYENNNALAQSYTLPITFSGNNATKNTNGSNCHITSDNDYYKIVLPGGYNYTVKPRIHDSYNSGNGNTYTLDGLFSYSTNGSTWSSAYDDVMPGNIALNGGGTLYFHVAPYFAGETGSYLLDMTLTRTPAVGIDVTAFEHAVLVYPNPATDYLFVDGQDLKAQISEARILNAQGQEVLTFSLTGEKMPYRMGLESLSSGQYLLQLNTEKGILSKKIMIAR